MTIRSDSSTGVFISGLHQREYQTQALESAQLSREVGYQRGLALMPPGAGKTFVGFEDALLVCEKYWHGDQNA